MSDLTQEQNQSSFCYFSVVHKHDTDGALCGSTGCKGYSCMYDHYHAENMSRGGQICKCTSAPAHSTLNAVAMSTVAEPASVLPLSAHILTLNAMLRLKQQGCHPQENSRKSSLLTLAIYEW